MEVSDKARATLFAIPVPPPFSGPEINGELALRLGLGHNFCIHHLPTNVTPSNQLKGTLGIAKLAALMGFWLGLVVAMIRFRPEIVYLYLSQNLTGFFRDATIVMTARLMGARVIAHVRGGNFQNFYEHSNLLIRRLICLILSQLSYIILLAERFRGQFKGLIPERRIRVLYNAVDLDLFDGVKSQRQVADNAVTILFIGHLSIAKGFFDLLRAAPQVLDGVPGSTFAFAGEWLATEKNIFYSEDGRRLEHDSQDVYALWTKLQHRYNGRLRHLGTLPRQELAAAVKAADIFVFPSYSEGFPVVVLEAMAAGLPVVATPVGALPEVLKNGVNAIFVSPGDIDALARTLLELARQPELRERMGQANRDLVRANFSPEAMAARLALIFRECMTESPDASVVSQP
jgi:glycosyltransferase involved in cell wall biosynthesis